MSDLRIWETFRAPLTPEDPHYVECQPDLYVPDLLDITPDMVVGLGVEHVFVDFDGTMAANGNMPPVERPVLRHLSQFAVDPRFKTFGIATDNSSSYMEDIAEGIGLGVRLYQPRDTPRMSIMKYHPGFYKRILFDAEIWDNPELAVMIGDSLLYDILAPQQLGMKTILVDRMRKRQVPDLRERLAT